MLDVVGTGKVPVLQIVIIVGIGPTVGHPSRGDQSAEPVVPPETAGSSLVFALGYFSDYALRVVGTFRRRRGRWFGEGD